MSSLEYYMVSMSYLVCRVIRKTSDNILRDLKTYPTDHALQPEKVFKKPIAVDNQSLQSYQKNEETIKIKELSELTSVGSRATLIKKCFTSCELLELKNAAFIGTLKNQLLAHCSVIHFSAYYSCCEFHRAS